MGADILERLDFMLISRRSDEDAIIRDARAEIGRLREKAGELAIARSNDIAEIVRLRGEVDSLRGWFDASRAPSNMSDDHDDAAGDDADDIAPEEAKGPAPAMPNGVEADLSAELDAMTAAYERMTAYTIVHKGQLVYMSDLGRAAYSDVVAERDAALRAADNRDAAGVSDDDFVHPEYIRGFNDGAKATPAAVPAGETNGDAPADVLEHLIFSVDRVANSGDYGLCDQAVVQLNYAIEDARRGIGTGTPQPADGEAGAALYGMFRALVDAGGATTVARHGAMPRPEKLMDALTRGMLAIERMFHPERFELDEFPRTAARPPAPVQAAPQEGEADGDSRASFERWAKSRLYSTQRSAVFTDGYVIGEVNMLWLAWQAALAAHPSACELGAVDDAMVDRAMGADAEEYGASIPQSRVRRILEAALQHRGDSREVGRG